MVDSEEERETARIAAELEAADNTMQEADPDIILIPVNKRKSVTLKRIENGLTPRGGTVIFVIEAHEYRQTEVFYSWINFPAANAVTKVFHYYKTEEPPEEYIPFEEVEVPLKFQEHLLLFNGALKHNNHITRLGPLGRPGATWPGLAGYTPHPDIEGMSAAALLVQLKQLIKVHRQLVQYVMRTSTIQPAIKIPQLTPHHGNTNKITPQNIQSCLGKVPAKREQIPLWLAQKITQIEAVFPDTTPLEKHRILTICLPMGIAPHVEDCDTWGTVFASIYTKTHGVPSMSVIPDVLKQIQDEYGPEPALTLGMKLLKDFKQVSAILLANIKGEAANVAIHQRLKETDIADQPAEIARIIEKSYEELVRDSLGGIPSWEGNKQSYPKEKRFQTRGRSPRRRERSPDQGRKSPQREPSVKKYNLRNRDNIKKPDRYQDNDTRPSQSFQTSSQKSERRGRSEHREEHVKSKDKEPAHPNKKLQFPKKKVASIKVINNAENTEDTTEKRRMGSDNARQRSRSEHSSQSPYESSGDSGHE
ncbi:uncharacterized protein LOC144819605 [Lissotriton helveticus]